MALSDVGATLRLRAGCPCGNLRGMELAELLVVEDSTAASLARRVGCHRSYVTRALKRNRTGRSLAVRIFKATGRKIGPIANASDEQIAALEEFA